MNREPLHEISPDKVQAFQADGAVHLAGMIDPDWIARLRDGVARTVEKPTPLHTVQTTETDRGFFLSDLCMAQQYEEYRDFVLNGPVGQIAASVMGSKRVNFFADTLWVKSPGTGKRTRWHQDQAFFWIDGRQVCVIWWPLDPIPKADSLELVRGSHQWGKWFMPELSKQGADLYKVDPGANPFERMPDIDGNRGDYEILSWDVEPGDCVTFHGSTVHGAPGSTAGRRAVSTVWLGDDAVYTERPSAGRPHFAGHDLAPGDSMDSDYFPRVWPRDTSKLLDGAKFRRFADPGLEIRN
jgi:ectoine hydroxylase-related dioxygenase (phytanoyl-CoA dioxygenase family)